MSARIAVLLAIVAVQTCRSQFTANFEGGLPQGLGFNFNNDNDNSNKLFAGIPNLFTRALSNGFNLGLNRQGQPSVPNSSFRIDVKGPSGSTKTSNSFRMGFGSGVGNYGSLNSSVTDTTEKPSVDRISLSSADADLPKLLTPRRNFISTSNLREPAFDSGFMASQLDPLETASLGRKINFGSDTELSFDSRQRQRALTAAATSQRFTSGGSSTVNIPKGVSRIMVNTNRVEPSEHGVVEFSQKSDAGSDTKFQFKPVTTVLKKRLHKIQIPVYNGYDEGASCDAKSPFLLLHSEELGDGRTRYFHCIDGSMKAVICPSDKPALQDICNGYNKHCWRYLAFDASIDPKQIADNAYQYYRCLGKL